MANKPFGPKEHCAIDYGFVTTLFSAPSLFHLKGPARLLCYLFGGSAGGLTALTIKERNARRFFFSFAAVVLTNYLLTNYEAVD